MRAQLRAQGLDRKGARFTSNIAPPPPICNRVATEWHKPEAPCECHRWPQYLASTVGVSTVAEVAATAVDADNVKGTTNTSLT